MAALGVQIREEVLAAIVSRKQATGFILNDFDAESDWLPASEKVDIPDGGKVWVVTLGADDLGPITRTNISSKEIPIQVAYQRAVDPTDKSLLDKLQELVEQLGDTCRKLDTNFKWLRNEYLKDEGGTPFSYGGLREGNYFEAFFSAFYQTTIN